MNVSPLPAHTQPLNLFQVPFLQHCPWHRAGTHGQQPRSGGLLLAGVTLPWANEEEGNRTQYFLPI